MKTIELYQLIHDNGEWADGVQNGDIHSDNITARTAESLRAQLTHLGILDRFRFESKGLFKVETFTYTERTLPQYLIDQGCDCDTYEVTQTTYTKIH